MKNPDCVLRPYHFPRAENLLCLAIVSLLALPAGVCVRRNSVTLLLCGWPVMESSSSLAVLTPGYAQHTEPEGDVFIIDE